MNPIDEYKLNITRRYFFQQGSHVLGSAALMSLMAGDRLLGATDAGTFEGRSHQNDR